MAKTVIWLDDNRNPESMSWAPLIESYVPDVEAVVWVKSYQLFVETVPTTENIVGVFFDYHLGTTKTGLDAFEWLDTWLRETDHEPVILYAQTAHRERQRDLYAGFKRLRRYWRKKGLKSPWPEAL